MTLRQYVLVEGGLVTDSPAGVDVFDLDVLSSEFVDDLTVQEVRELIERMSEFDKALDAQIERCKAWLRERGYE